MYLWTYWQMSLPPPPNLAVGIDKCLYLPRQIFTNVSTSPANNPSLTDGPTWKVISRPASARAAGKNSISISTFYKQTPLVLIFGFSSNADERELHIKMLIRNRLIRCETVNKWNHKLRWGEMSASAKEYFNRTVGNTGGCCGRIDWKKCLLGHEQPYDFITRRVWNYCFAIKETIWHCQS